MHPRDRRLFVLLSSWLAIIVAIIGGGIAGSFGGFPHVGSSLCVAGLIGAYAMTLHLLETRPRAPTAGSVSIILIVVAVVTWASVGWETWITFNKPVQGYTQAQLDEAVANATKGRNPVASMSPGFTQQQVDEKIANSVASLNAQLSEANRQKDTAIRDAETLRKQIQNTPPPPRPNYDEPRVYTTKTMDDLRGFYKNRTALQGSAFMADEIGKWINTEGAIQFIRPDGLVFLADNAGTISCEFDSSWKPKLSAFRPGETMKVTGKIGEGQIGYTPIYLRPWEIRN